MSKNTVCATAVAAIAGSAAGQVVTVDFSVGTAGPLVNGQAITGSEVSPFFTLSSSGPSNNGLAIFDTTPSGPNSSAEDQDLLVGLGNALILQDSGEDNLDGDGNFDPVDDDAQGGTMSFAFTGPVELLSIDLIDMDAGNGGSVTLTDLDGDTLVYTIPASWTNDINANGPSGFDTLDLTITTPQTGEAGGVATAVADADFDAADVVALDVFLVGSGGIDNIVFDTTFIPTPGAVAIAAIGGLASLRRRR